MSKVGFRETRAGPKAYGRIWPQSSTQHPPLRPPQPPFNKGVRVVFFLTSPRSSFAHKTPSCQLEKSPPLSTERVWQEAFKLDFSPYSSWISVPCAVNNLFNDTLQPSSLAWTTPDTLKGHGEGPTLSEAELLGTGGDYGPHPCPNLFSSHEVLSTFTSHPHLPIPTSSPTHPRLGNAPDIVFQQFTVGGWGSREG